ncbi:hypothetical protein [Pelagicoccus sp. SDUM812003]|uniref:hypothetical protein n=1 Tax=Pelagicoccus sp. SDUM812003 TaxID=3041267 RepID=UPI00280CF41B|nr:hypothetical protein [Pelagicoccus sp. SDUM812003]MDQ8202030.1 hypothetical protein [Pelagicoccus sp. SDUM812003]
MRKRVIEEAVAAIDAIHLPHPVRVGIDGMSASGKTVFADSLVEPLQARGRHVIRASIDGFHHASEVRYRKGEYSVDGYVQDSFDKEAVVEQLLTPLGPGGALRYTPSRFDFVTDVETQASLEEAMPDSILIFEGVMLFCERLAAHFDFRIFVDASEETVLRRASSRDVQRLGGMDTLLEKYRRRYLPGQSLYAQRHRPVEQAHLVIDNNDYDLPRVLARRLPVARSQAG